ncbi:MAG: hypothetical protein IPH57_09590 [Saprospiraceae bacterium]|nr:hypothetical protein [Saprospiraceae bacterium]
MKSLLFEIILILFFTATSQLIAGQTPLKDKKYQRIEKKLSSWDNIFSGFSKLGNISIDSFSLNKTQKSINIFFNSGLANAPVREINLTNAKISIKKQLGRKFRKYSINLYAGKTELSTLIPNYLRKDIVIDQSRFNKIQSDQIPIIRKKYFLEPIKGLKGYNLAVWHSHGRYYEAKLDRWEWQRARLHSTVEDIFPLTFVIDFLAPMLENAGANIFIPRERDFNKNEVIVDNDISTGKSKVLLPGYFRIDTIDSGFKYKDTLFNNENPFRSGTYLMAHPDASKQLTIRYIPDIPKTGEYAVYISYGAGGSKIVNYTINYTGGFREFLVDQTQGAGTWIYLGTFYFQKGFSPDNASVTIVSTNTFTSDAIRFGGGMGNVARRPSDEIMPNIWSLAGQKKEYYDEIKTTVNPENYSWKLSGMPRYLEGSRYYLQYSGMPDTSVYSLTKGKNDYNDDYQSRPEWVNYLIGNNEFPFRKDDLGLNIPIDAVLAFHTDAGVANEDSIIGTLGIYSSDKPDSIFASGQSKMTSRDLSDMIQTQIVEDISNQYGIAWTRRGLWNRPYSEAWRPNVPTMLLELLSHQNLTDIKYGLDPRFKFIVSRAIYKGMLKFLSFQNQKPYVVQALPVNNFSISSIGGKKIKLSWSPVADQFEKTAVPQAYMVYTRTEGLGFDQGFMVKDTFAEIELSEFDKIYSFKITALNEGGESFPSEILSAGLTEKSNKTALIVNSFDRVCGPAVYFDSKTSGVAYWKDMGVPYKHELSFVGYPYDFDFKNPWTDDDNPGWGASFSDNEGIVIAGNSFDYPFVHGKAILLAGCSFLSTSDEAFEKEDFIISGFNFIDIIFGEEKTTKPLMAFNSDNYKVFSESMKNKIQTASENKINIFLSGAYIASDNLQPNDSLSEKFASDVLHYKWRTVFASRTGCIQNTDLAKRYFDAKIIFNTALDENFYMVESPDGIEPVGDNSVTCFRYCDSGASAGIAYDGKYRVVAMGFPFETIIKEEERNILMKQIVDFFSK